MSYRRNSYNNRHRRYKKSKIKAVPLILFLTLLISLPYAIYTQAKSFSLQNEYNTLLESINETEVKNNEIQVQNEKLLSTVEEKKSEYAVALENAKIAYLTFDDGPSENTMEILDILDRYNIKATFFVNGHPEYKDLYKEISDRGHVIANHTFSHDYNYVYSSVDNFKADVNKLNDLIKEATGKEPTKLLRYPGGSNNTVSYGPGGKEMMPNIIKAMDEEGYVFFDWNADSTDGSGHGIPKETLVSRVLGDAKYVDKANVLMHDTNSKNTTVQALPEIIEGLQAQGFIFDVLSEDSFAPQFTKIPE